MMTVERSTIWMASAEDAVADPLVSHSYDDAS